MLPSTPSLPQPIVVTGGAGFIGRHLVERLLQASNTEVVVFDVPGAAIPPAWHGRVRVVAGDVADPGELCLALNGAGYIFHTAAVVSDWAPAAEYERVNLQGSRNVFEAAVQSGAQVQLLSSCAAYGDWIGRQVLREDLALARPVGRYSLYKQRQEQLGWQYQRERGLRLTVVRPSKVYGPGSRPWVHEVARVLRRGRPALIDGGNYNPGLVYVDHLVDIMLLAAARPGAVGRAYNGYDGTTVSLRQYFTDLARIVGAPPPRSMPRWFARLLAAVIEPAWRLLRIKSRPLLTRDSLRLISSNYQISLDRVQSELGFTPRVSYAEALERVSAYWNASARP